MNSETSASVPNGSSGRGVGGGEERPDGASQVKREASDPGREAADKLAGNQEGAAQDSQDAGPSPHADAQSRAGGARVSRAARAAAASLRHAAQHIRDRDAAGVMTSVRRVVKDNPVPALTGAAILGFVLARVLYRD